MAVGLSEDPAAALRHAATLLAPLVLCGLLSTQEVCQRMEEAALRRGLNPDVVAAILHARLTAWFN